MDEKLLDKFRRVRLLALDCDVVLTPAYIETGVIMDPKSSQQYEVGRIIQL